MCDVRPTSNGSRVGQKSELVAHATNYIVIRLKSMEASLKLLKIAEAIRYFRISQIQIEGFGQTDRQFGHP
jgi:hypothetical protein